MNICIVTDMMALRLGSMWVLYHCSAIVEDADGSPASVAASITPL
jgi:hypothetical protein